MSIRNLKFLFMYEFILQLAVFFSLGVVLFIMARAVPRIQSESEVIHQNTKFDYFDRFLGKIPLNKLDFLINSFLSKILRRIKVVVLKIDNFITNYLNKLLKKTNNNGTINGGNDKPQ